MKGIMNIYRPNATFFKQFFIVTMVVLVLADVFFLLNENYSTISQVALYSSPKYMVFIWLFGVMTMNFFFPRNKSTVKIKKSVSIFLTVSVGIILLFAGHAIAVQKDCESADFPSVEVPYYMEATCREFSKNARVDCDDLKCKKQKEGYVLQDEENTVYILKYDLTPEMKLLLMIFGFIFGYLIWPQSIEENVT